MTILQLATFREFYRAIGRGDVPAADAALLKFEHLRLIERARLLAERT